MFLIGKVFVTYYHEHKSLSFELSHINLHADEMQEIAKLLTQGVPPDSEHEGNKQVSHLHLLTNKPPQSPTHITI